MDPISDFLTVIRNGYRAGKETCETRYSKLHLSIAEILKAEGYISEVEKIDEDGKQSLVIKLKYVDEVPALTGIKRVSNAPAIFNEHAIHDQTTVAIP